MPHSLDVLCSIFEDRVISRRADVYYLWGAVKDKCYADKPKTIDALKDIGEIQLHPNDTI